MRDSSAQILMRPYSGQMLMSPSSLVLVLLECIGCGTKKLIDSKSCTGVQIITLMMFCVLISINFN